MTEHFLKYIHWDIDGNAQEVIQRHKALERKERG
jgi:hypothetical protein